MQKIHYGKTRTNYFSVTDENKFKEIIGMCRGDGEVEIISNDKGKFGFMCEGSILGFPEDIEENKDNFGCHNCGHTWYAAQDSESDATDFCPECNSANVEEIEYYNDDVDYSYDKFCEALQTVLPDNEAIIITEIGSEKMRYLSGHSMVITNKQTKFVDLRAESLNAARVLLGLSNYNTPMEY